MRRAISFLALSILVANTVPARAATQEEIARAINRGTEFLKKRAENDLHPSSPEYEAGELAITGLALLESGVRSDDASVKTIAEKIRELSYSQIRTYNLALCTLFLDRLGQREDVPLIQLLGARLLVGQHRNGWSYTCIPEVPAVVVQQLKARLRVSELTTGGVKAQPPETVIGANRLHTEVVRYAATIRQAREEGEAADNSNTQFAILGLWTARRHGLDVERALAAVELHFLATQLPNGGWGYNPGGEMRPSMTCAGLIGIAMAIARRDEKATVGAVPTVPGVDKKPAPPANDLRENSARRGVIALASTLAGLRGQSINRSSHEGANDLYYLWSVERVGVVYKIDLIAGVDWYAVGADSIVRHQRPDGSWEYHGSLPGTALALLFLNKANFLKDIRAVKDEQFAELRSGDLPQTPKTSSTAKIVPPRPAPVPALTLPTTSTDDAVLVAAELLRAGDADWPRILTKLRDEKGSNFTRGLVLAVNKLDGDHKKQAREALSERLTRMTAATLREMLKSEEPELRRAAALACAMKDDSTHIPDLIERLTDESAVVGPAARAGLKSLTGQDFGPSPTATLDERRKASDSWKAWYARNKK